MSQAPTAPTRSRRGPWLAVVVGTILLAGAVDLTAVLNEQPPLQPVTVSSATP
jgi:hypothetical protein